MERKLEDYELTYERVYKNILHIFTKAEFRDEYFNKVKSGNLVKKIDNRRKEILSDNLYHIFIVIRGVSDTDKLRGMSFCDVEYHQTPERYESIMKIESRVWKDPNTIHLPIPREQYFNKEDSNNV